MITTKGAVDNFLSFQKAIANILLGRSERRAQYGQVTAAELNKEWDERTGNVHAEEFIERIGEASGGNEEGAYRQLQRTTAGDVQ